MIIDELILDFNETVYSPEEDTFTMARALDRWFQEHQPPPPSRILEIGCGSGYLIIRLAKFFPHHEYFATDVNWKACLLAHQNARNNGTLVHVTCQDLLKGFIHQKQQPKFDLIFFNPPYIPSSSLKNELLDSLDIATMGGTQGIEIITKFLQQVPQVTAPTGHVLLLTTHWNPQDQIQALARLYFQEVRPYYQRKTLSERHVVYLMKNKKNTSLNNQALTS